MKILFIHSVIARVGFDSFLVDQMGDSSRWGDSLGISYLAGAVMAAGHETAYLDLRRLKGWDETEERIAASGADVVGLSFQSPDRDFGFQAARIAKRLGKKVIVGGVHASLQPEECEEAGLFDTVFTGPGELALVEWLAAAEKGERLPRRVEGASPRDLDTLPFPHYFPEQEEVMRALRKGRIVISRGCYGKCAYCYPSLDRIYGKGILTRDIEAVRREIRHLVERYRIRLLRVVDNLSLSNRKKTREFAEMMEEFPQIKYVIATRAELINEEVADILAPQTILVELGIESASQRMLDFMNKKTLVEQNYEAVRILRKHGIPVLSFMINGLPGQRREDYEANLDFLRDANPEVYLSGCYEPAPGTLLHEYCRDNGLLPETFPYEWLEGGMVAKHRLIKGVDYDLVFEYADKVGHLIDRQENPGRDYLFTRLCRANEWFWDVADRIGRDDEWVVLRAAPPRVILALMRWLYDIVAPERVTLFTTDPLDVERYPRSTVTVLPPGHITPASLNGVATGKKFSGGIMAFGGMERKSYAGAEAAFDSLPVAARYKFDPDFSIKEFVCPP